MNKEDFKNKFKKNSIKNNNEKNLEYKAEKAYRRKLKKENIDDNYYEIQVNNLFEKMNRLLENNNYLGLHYFTAIRLVNKEYSNYLCNFNVIYFNVIYFNVVNKSIKLINNSIDLLREYKLKLEEVSDDELPLSLVDKQIFKLELEAKLPEVNNIKKKNKL